MKFNSQIKNTKSNATNSDQAIKLRINDQRWQVKESDLIAIKVHVSEP